jgi:hypothetical protein
VVSEVPTQALKLLARQSSTGGNFPFIQKDSTCFPSGEPLNKNTRDILISLLALGVIFSGIRYHMMRERLSHADLHSWYQQENATAFGGSLQDASVEWGDLREKNAEGITYKYEDDSFAIVLDRNSNTSESEARDTLKHEACHVATWGEEPKHGPKWQACMAGKTE